ncbi:unnamed protein product [Fusarium fujikuroi]|nr:unnamed protein product [Fusarium fujikuroi]VZI20168.1 unnamed protein product [Fusarium fujikuroi]
MPSRTSDTPNEWSKPADIISRFLALQQIYSAKELDSYLQSLQQIKEHESDAENQSPDVVVLCASAILAIPEAVFEWVALQQSQDEGRQRNTVLVLCGGIGPCTPFVYDAIRASKKYCTIFDTINGKPEGEVLKVMAERFYKLKINETWSRDNGFRILVSDRSNNCGADATEAQKVLQENDIWTPRSMVVVQDPAMSSRTMSSFEKVYETCAVHISCWPLLKEPRQDQQKKSRHEQDARRELWSMDRFLDRIIGEQGGVIRAKSPIGIPNEISDQAARLFSVSQRHMMHIIFNPTPLIGSSPNILEPSPEENLFPGPGSSRNTMASLRRFSLVFYVPPASASACKTAIFKAGAGRYPGPGGYTECAWQTSGIGQFRPGDAANPAIGKVGELEETPEVRVETLIVGEETVRKAVAALKEAHPYEECPYQVYRVEDF